MPLDCVILFFSLIQFSISKKKKKKKKTSNESGMKLQVVSNFNLVNNQATSCFRAQTSQEWNYKLNPISNNRKWSYKLFLTSNESGMKLQIVSNFNLVNNEATSCFQLQSGQ